MFDGWWAAWRNQREHVIDEGYSGKPEKCRGLVEIGSVRVAVSEYKDFLSVGACLPALCAPADALEGRT